MFLTAGCVRFGGKIVAQRNQQQRLGREYRRFSCST